MRVRKGLLRGHTKANAVGQDSGAGREVWEEGKGGEGVWDPKGYVPKMAQSDLPAGKCRFFPRRSLWSGGGGGGRGG